MMKDKMTKRIALLLLGGAVTLSAMLIRKPSACMAQGASDGSGAKNSANGN